MTPLDALLTTVLVALAATALTIILRNAPIIRGWVFAMKKPWACNVCMPLYTTAVLVVPTVYYDRHFVYGLVYLAAYLLSHLILEAMSRPPAAGPPPIPSLLGPDDLEEE